MAPLNYKRYRYYTDDNGNTQTVPTAVIAIIVVVGVVIFCLLLFLCLRSKRKKSTTTITSISQSNVLTITPKNPVRKMNTRSNHEQSSTELPPAYSGGRADNTTSPSSTMVVDANISIPGRDYPSFPPPIYNREFDANDYSGNR